MSAINDQYKPVKETIKILFSFTTSPKKATKIKNKHEDNIQRMEYI